MTEILDTMKMPNLLVDWTWPTKTEQASVEAADSDGDVKRMAVADVDLEADIWECHAGVNR